MVFTYHNFWGQLPSPPKSMPMYLKCDESVRGCVTLPIPPTHKNTTQKYLPDKKQTTPEICSCRCRRSHRCSRVLHQDFPTPSPPASPPSPLLALLLALLPQSSLWPTSSLTSSPTSLPTVVCCRLPLSLPRSLLIATGAAVHHLPSE